jgi:hypothetical protein
MASGTGATVVPFAMEVRSAGPDALEGRYAGVLAAVLRILPSGKWETLPTLNAAACLERVQRSMVRASSCSWRRGAP